MATTIRSVAAYIRADGSETSSRAQGAVGITEPDLIAYVKAYSSKIPVGYFIGVAQRESGKVGDLFVTNEHDTDFKEDGSTYESFGIFQMGRTEAIRAHIIPTADNLIDPENNVKCAAVTFERNLDKIMDACRAYYGDYFTPQDELYCYLAWAHTAGYGEPVTSIGKYGLDWEALKVRNHPGSWMIDKMVPYAEFVLGETRRLYEFGTGEANTNEQETNVLLLIAGAGAFWLLTRGA